MLTKKKTAERNPEKYHGKNFHNTVKPISLMEYLVKLVPDLSMVSIGQVMDDSVYEDDFRREFGHIDGVVAIDVDEHYAGWKLGIVESMAIKPAEVWELLDGIIVY